MEDLDEQIGADIVAKVWLPLFTQPVLYLIILSYGSFHRFYFVVIIFM